MFITADLTTLGTIRSDGDGDADADTEKDSRVVPEVPVPMPEMENLTRRDTSETVPMVHEKADFVLAYSTVPGGCSMSMVLTLYVLNFSEGT